ncbi:MAG: tyrosine--tRNA ligase [Candidatus Marinimicrobia bacterium]|jgi:tyrosyl-tRNA synthetase|nr:tyrosine--tRNA ligase [Candidatus Neomarinimicrobiota bacterium]MDP6593026.1 tyrosine--tRNA ligase [Candidatus Neomarinimicrobiota bacterium]|tara:strand:+ start:6949 stop:8163 length:1215 start_codon:yes stop_codon:yes gene_type:complete
MSNFPPIKEQMKLIRRGVDEIIPEEQLEKKLQQVEDSGEPLVVKLGCDPSRPDLHIGHAVVLRKLRHFQDLGHQSVLVIGDFTALIGDPSGRNKTRPQLTEQEVAEFGKTYVDQASHILDLDTLKIVHNSKWLSAMNFNDVIRLSSRYTVARMLERDDFEKRYRSEVPISIHEFMYPLAQAMDSIQLNADIELGGTDQKFNLLVGRDLQRDHGQEPQVVITTPLLEGTDGVQKMSKSYENYIAITDSPKEMYGKTMSIPDNLMETYFEFATDVQGSELTSIRKQLKDSSLNPRDLKRRLARDIVTLYHSDAAAESAEREFDTIFVRDEVPEDMKTWHAAGNPIGILELLAESGLASSKRDARRLIEQGAVRVDGERVSEITAEIDVAEDRILKVGKRKFLKITS